MTAGVLAAYALAVALVLACSAWLLERALTNLHQPVRWVWVGALGLSVWLPLASFVSGPRQRATASSAGVAEVVAPIAQAGVVGGTSGGSEPGVGAGLAMFGEWSTGVNRVLASGVALLPAIGLAPAWIAGGWWATSILVAIVLLTSILRLNRRARRWPDAALLGRQVRVSPDIGPATVGLLTPRIVIPRWATALPRQELELVLHHEAEHVRSRDTLLLALGLAAVVACPWNPLVWWQVRRLKAAVEVDCDRRVLRNGVAPARYGDLLVRLGIAGRLGSLLVPTIAGSTSLLERRLTAMTNMRRRISVPRAVGAIALALLLVGVACTADPPVATDRRATELTEESRVDNSTELEQTLRREAGEVTYIDDVAGILTQNCQICHQKGGASPMPLVTYDDVRPWAFVIKALVNRAPLADHYDADVSIQRLENDGRLAAEEIRTITEWVDAGAPIGGAVPRAVGESAEVSRAHSSSEREQTQRRDAGEVAHLGDVAGILKQNCQICHQKGGVGSMALVSYDDVRPWAHMIKVLVNRAPLADHYELDVLKQGLENDGRLSAEEIRTITAWVDAGAPMDGAGNIPSASSR